MKKTNYNNNYSKDFVKNKVLEKGKIWYGRDGISNPIKFDNIDLSKFKKV